MSCFKWAELFSKRRNKLCQLVEATLLNFQYLFQLKTFQWDFTIWISLPKIQNVCSKFYQLFISLQNKTFLTWPWGYLKCPFLICFPIKFVFVQKTYFVYPAVGDVQFSERQDGWGYKWQKMRRKIETHLDTRWELNLSLCSYCSPRSELGGG